jgi:RNA polymerase sigma-70 factor (ECF subfamily)
MAENPDLKLVRRLLAGDARSFDAFFGSYYPRLYRFALARLDGDADLAEDTAQVVLCQALSKFSTYRGEAPLFSWLCTFCRHEVSRQRKARGRVQGDRPLTEDDPAVRSALDALLAESSLEPDVAVYEQDVRRLVKVTLDCLPSLYSDVLEAKYVSELSVNEIAERLGKSPKATESILSRARVAFRDAMRVLLRQEQGGDFDGPSSVLGY